jgi:hypothetical protein
MPTQPTLIYWDSCVFLYYLDRDSDKLPVLDAVLNNVERSAGNRRIVTSTVAKVEVAFATIDAGCASEAIGRPRRAGRGAGLPSAQV